ncbi:MAG: hypothetical protein JNM93_12280 [Bacteriovoracaceae bacterium]|nr:hypothetical protein [Bacteriovoracaceae bacterium]
MIAEDKGSEKLFDGHYRYLKDGNEYSQEIFSVTKNLDAKTIIYSSEILSRVSTGEFLKIKCHYEVNSSWNPTKVNVIKSLGNEFADELYEYDTSSQILKYTFLSDGPAHQVERAIGGKFHISTPAVLTSLLFTMQKRYNSVSRNQYYTVVSVNDWIYEGAPEDRFIYLEYKTGEKEELKINGQSLSSTKCMLYEHDSIHNVKENPVIYYQSKHIGIPYKADLGEGIEVVISNLKEWQTETYEFKDVFKS